MKISQTQLFTDTIQAYQFGSWPWGKPKMLVYLYFVDGLLIDTGQPNMKKEVLAAVSNLPVEQIYATHHHEDHTGNLLECQQLFNCPSYASSLCVEFMKKPPRISIAQHVLWGDRPANFDLQAKDHSISTTNYTFQIIPIPGHATDMVALYEANQGWLFSADLFINRYIGYFMRGESMKQQISSTKKVLTLDFDLLLCNHNPQLQQGKERLAQKLQFLEDFYGKVAQLHQQGYSANAIVNQLKLKKYWFTWFLSTGQLSTWNMVRSVMRDEEKA